MKCTAISMESYSLIILIDFDALCADHDHSVNAVLRLKCAEGTIAPTSDPTTIQPTQATNEPSETPSNAPTFPTPTFPTTWSVLCDPVTNTWCYNVEISPSFVNATEWTVLLQYDDSRQSPNVDGVTLRVSFHVSGIADNDCVEPTLALIYETIDYDKPHEYMQVTEGDTDSNVAQCGWDNPSAECNVFETCFEGYRLVPSNIRKDETYEITVYQSQTWTVCAPQ